MTVPDHRSKPHILVNTRIGADLPSQIAHDKSPAVDYLELAQKVGSHTLDYRSINVEPVSFVAQVVERVVRLDIRLALVGARHVDDCQGFVTMWEGTGLPLALLLGKKSYATPQVMITHYLLSPYKRWWVRLSGALHRIHKIICLAESARRAYQHYYHLPDHRLETIHYGIDHRFFRPMPGSIDNSILSIGSSKRDYRTLLQAVEELDVTLRLRAASNWNPQNVLKTRRPAGNIEPLEQCSFTELREWYRRSRFVVVPLRPTMEFSAGITSALEAAAMGKAVIATRTSGMAEYVQNGETGILVEPGNVEHLRNAIQFLLNQPDEAERMGQNGRLWVERERNLDLYVTKLVNVFNEAIATAN